jgi:hypothetical protein
MKRKWSRQAEPAMMDIPLFCSYWQLHTQEIMPLHKIAISAQILDRLMVATNELPISMKCWKKFLSSYATCRYSRKA